jgi:membrane protease YdiL (CAAX protease family)
MEQIHQHNARTTLVVSQHGSGVQARGVSVMVEHSTLAVDEDNVSSRALPGPRTRRLAPWPSPTARSRSWTVRYALTAYVAMWVILIALGLAFWLLGVHAGIGFGALLTEAVLLATLIPLWRRSAVGARDLGLRLVPGGRATALAFLGLFAYGWISVLWRRALHPAPISSNFANISHHSTAAIVLAGFVACVGAPVAEEIFFRGFLYRCLRNRLTVITACLITAVLFALIHTQYPLAGKLAVGCFSLITCLLYERTGSLLPGIAIHSFVDGSGFERALTGNASVIAWVYLLLAVILLAAPPLRGLGRRLTGRPVFRDYPVPKDDTAETPYEPSPRQATPLDGSDPADAFGASRRQGRIARLAGVLCVLLVLFLLVPLSRPSVRLQLNIGSRYASCTAAGIDSAEGHEGTCVEGSFSSLTTVNVVDRARTLRMPEYDARLLESQIAPTRVRNASENEDLYPHGAGQLVSYELSITNTGKRPLRFGVGTGYERRASYSPSPDVELALPESLQPTSSYVTTYPPIIEGFHSPTPSILQQSPIAPNETRTGWVSFVAPAWALSVLTKRGADVEFYKVNGDTHYRGSIRLWK